MNEKLPTEDVLIVALVVRWTVQAVEMAAVLSGERQWCVIEADCLHVLPWLPDKSVSHVIEDPPYSPWVHGQHVVAGTLRDGTPRFKEIDFLALTGEGRLSMAMTIARLVTRWCLVFCDAEGAFPWMGDLQAGGLDHVPMGVWHKIGASPQFSGDRPAPGVEMLEIAHQPGRKRWNGGGKHAVWSHAIEHGDDRAHPTQKPLPLMLELVGLFTDPGEVILDAFAGSGTTGVAALRLGRRAILIERDPKYAAIARQRMEAEERGQSLKEYRAGQRTLCES